MVAARFHRDVMPNPFDDDHILHGRAVPEGVIYDALELDNFAVVVTAIHRDDELGLAVVNAALQRIDREATKHHRMDRADLGTGQHGKDDLRHASHIDRDAVAFPHAHGFDDVCHAAHFAVHGVIGIGLVQLAIFTFPDQCQFIFAIGFEMTVNRVMNDIGFPSHEPLEERLVGIIQHLVPFLEPFQFFGFLRPKRLWILSEHLQPWHPNLSGLPAQLLHRMDNKLHLPFLSRFRQPLLP